MKMSKEAVNCFAEGYNCAQSIFSTYSPDFGLDKVTALKISSAYGGGIARMGETCGAVTGAMMIIGLKYGGIAADDKQAKERNYELVREFVNKFVQCHGSIKCKELLDCDISNPEGAKTAKEKQLFTTLCPKYVEDAAVMLEEIINK